MIHLRNKFIPITRSRLNRLALYGKIVRGEPYLLLNENLIAIGLNIFSYGTFVFTELPILNIGYRSYIIAGCSNDSVLLDSIEVLYLNTETIDMLSDVISEKKAGHCGLSSREKGYWCGGYNLENNSLQTIESLQFDNESLNTLNVNLSDTRNNLTGMSSDVKGYWCGGYSIDDILYTVDYIYFYDESILTTLTFLNDGICFYTTLSLMDDEVGYLFGGYSKENYLLNTITKFLFSVETFTLLFSSLSYEKDDSTCVKSKNNDGYIAGGYGKELYSTIEKFLNKTETLTTISSLLSYPRTSLESTYSDVKGYWFGGYDNEYYTTGSSNIIEGIEYNNETIFTPSLTLLNSRDSFTSVFY